MKRILALSLIILLLLSLFASCDSNKGEVMTDADGNTVQPVDKSGVDIDFTEFGDTYNTILGFMSNPGDYQGKSIAIKAQSSVIYNFEKNRIDKHIMLGIDPTGCCNSYYEIKTADGKYPKNGSAALFTGDFTSEGYISVTDCSPKGDDATYDIDTLKMSSDELKALISQYTASYKTSENSGKTIRIFGHHQIYNGYKWLLGLNGEGQAIWQIELYDPTSSLSFPIVSGNLVNPVEIIGTLSFYTEGEQTYACITVTEVNRVECVFG